MFKLTTISFLLFITTFINFITTYISWQRRKAKGGLYFALGMLAITFWTLMTGLDYSATVIGYKVLFAKFETLGYNSALVLLTIFALNYGGYEEWIKKPWVKFLFWGIPAINILLAFTNEFHYLYWTHYQFNPVQDNVLIFYHGSGFYFASITGYLLAITMFAVLWRASRQGPNLARQQAGLLFAALGVPLIGNLIYLSGFSGLEGVDGSSIALSLSGLLILIALYSTRLLNIVPIARHTIVEWMADSVLVLDTENRIVDFNIAAQNLFEINQTHIGQKIENVLIDWPQLIELSSDSTINIIHSTFKNEHEAKFFDANITILKNKVGVIYGRLISLRDITEYKKIEVSLAEQLLETENLHQNLQKSQTKIIEQQRILAKVEERQRIGRDMHDSVNQSIHGLLLFSETLAVLLKKQQPEQALHLVSRIQESGRQALKEIRLLVYESQFQTYNENDNLINALEKRLQLVEHRVGIQAELKVVGSNNASYPQDWNENLYWLTIEALNNTLKHAQAEKVLIKIDYSDQYFKLEVTDNGIGFKVDTLKNIAGFGTRTMQERTELLKGTLVIQSSRKKGTSVLLTIPKEA